MYIKISQFDPSLESFLHNCIMCVYINIHEAIKDSIFTWFCGQDYVHSKTSAEKEVLKYNGEKLKVVSLAIGVVGGETVQSTMSSSTKVLSSQILRDKGFYRVLRFLEELSGKIPIVHVQDVNEALIFCMENSALNGRFLCASAFLKSSQIPASVQKYVLDDIKIDDNE